MRIVAVLLAAALAGAACGDGGGGPPAGSPPQLPAATLNQSGSTFQKPFLEEMVYVFRKEQRKITVNVSGGGSGKGRQDLADQVTDLAAADGLPKQADLGRFKGGALLYFPTVAAPITVAFNLKRVSTLRLDAPTIAGIFQRRIRSWADPAIKALNPDLALPDKAITVAHRSDSSGTTENFTKYLKTAAPGVWTLDAGSTVRWPADTQAGAGNPGVAQIIQDTDGAVGYVDYSEAKALGLHFADIRNKAGRFVTPSLDGTSVAVENATVNADLSYNPLDAAGEAAYPIASPTWLITYKTQTNPAKAAALRAFLEFIYEDGQDIAGTVDYARLPATLVDRARSQLDQLTVPT